MGHRFVPENNRLAEYLPYARCSIGSPSGISSEGLRCECIRLGLHHDDTDRFLREAAPDERKSGYSPTGETGIYQCLKTQSGIAPGGQHIGFELLAMMFGLLTCSWLCNGLEAVCAEQLQVQTNE